MNRKGKQILAAGLAALLAAGTIALIGYAFSTGFISISAPSNRDLVDTPLARNNPAANSKPPAFQVQLAVIPGAARLPNPSSVGPAATRIPAAPAPQLARLPQAIELSQPHASALPEPIETPTNAHSALDIALHPSLKYAHWTPSVAIAHPSRAALDIPIAVYGQKTAALAASLKSSAKPATAAMDDAQTRQLIAANLKMEQDRRFVMSMCEDQQGCLWVGTEGGGVQRFDPRAPELHQWTQFTTKDGLGDDYAYALACDRLGRIWVGHLNHGVSVFNGQKWQCYEVVGGLSRPDTLSGPLGERVFAIKVCPTDGDVWIATSCGLSRYSEKLDTWAYYTRAGSGELGRTDGLPSDQANAIAFDRDGNIYVGTQCDGIVMASAASSYRQWRVEPGPSEAPLAPAGEGLPTRQINDLMAASDGTIYAATTAGLAWTLDHGGHWQFARGLDWADKVRGLYGGAPKGWQPTPGAWLAEDYVTCLSQDAQGRPLAGYRHKGYARLDVAAHHSVQLASPASIVTAVLPLLANTFVATYQADSLSSVGTDAQRPRHASPSPPLAVALPAGAMPTSEDQPAESAAKTTAASTDPPQVVYLGQDWSTQGDWVGRYGRQYAVLFAADWPFDHFITHGAIFYAVTAGNGQNLGGRKDVVRRWMHWRDPPYLRCLYDPSVGHRVESELDDHGETYPASLDGPDVCIWAKVPEGQSAVSLYFVNKDGHTGQNAERDYVVRVQKVQRLYDNGSSPTLASARVINFWGGVYEQFAVRGPAVFRFEIKRNHSLNAICSGIFIDRISGPSTFLDGMPMPSMGDVRYDPPSDPAFGAPAAAPRLAAAGRLWGEADSVRTESPSRAREEKILAFRMASAAGPDQLAGWRWQLRLWNNDDRRGFDVATAAAWPAFIQEMGINQASVR